LELDGGGDRDQTLILHTGVNGPIFHGFWKVIEKKAEVVGDPREEI